MPLTPGTRIGPYEIVAPIGAGGMGEVYRARDTTLNRDVALKILPDMFAGDPDRLARFTREAQTLAALNHPNIAHIYGLEGLRGRDGQDGRTQALVMELVDGDDVSQRLARGPLPLADVIPIARQIADALEAAHERGIIHRDLKPANIKVTPDGKVKVLDFGLAKALDPPPSSAAAAALANSPTITTPAMTAAGMILGTAAYMAPEQAKGRPVDKRADIWAFGCVLYEMLSGRRAFAGEDVSDTLAFVITKTPDWALLPAATPPSLLRILRRCLEKDRNQRLADIADVRFDLDESALEHNGAGLPGPPVRARTPARWLPWGVAAALLGTTLWLGTATLRDRPEPNTHAYWSSLSLPTRLGTLRGDSGATLSLSPDGRHLAFVGADPNGRVQLWVLNLDNDTSHPLGGTDDGTFPFWSPDSRWLAFVAGGKLKKIDAAGGPVTILCDAAAGGSWNRDDVIVFTQAPGLSLAKVAAAGGTPSALTTLDGKAGEIAHFSPFFLPDGRHIVYVIATSGAPPTVYVTALDSTARSRLLVDATAPQFAYGILMFARSGRLLAQAFDPGRLTLSGEAVPVAEHVRIDFTTNAAVYSISRTGALVFDADDSGGSEIVSYDRNGRRVGVLGAAADYADFQLSPDGRRASLSVAEAGGTGRDVWLLDVIRGVRTRFTFDATGVPRNSIWSPDGSTIVFASYRKQHADLFQKKSNGAGGEAVLLEDDADKLPMAWSPDGQFILYFKNEGTTGDLWVLPLRGDRKPFPFVQTPFLEVPAQFSPDGRWVVYSSNESGKTEVYVVPFPGPGGKSQVSTAGGFDARWRADGKEILYMSPNNKLMAAAVVAGRDHFETGNITALFDLPKVGPRWTYDVSPDGLRIFAVSRKEQAGNAALRLVINWPALLKK